MFTEFERDQLRQLSDLSEIELVAYCPKCTRAGEGPIICFEFEDGETWSMTFRPDGRVDLTVELPVTFSQN